MQKIKINIIKDISTVSVPQNISTNYSTYVENIAWQSRVNDLAIAGTSGRGLRIESLKVNLGSALQAMTVEYQTQVQNIG